MPKKYHLNPKPAASRFVPPGPFGIIEGDGCLNCPHCVKKDCAYLVYEKRIYDEWQMVDTADFLCKNCFRCVQECHARILSKSSNPEYWSMGDDYWTPEIIFTNQRQAESGKIPVSGGGYGGPFAGPGFDSMWTDMSEIVRPTRDGIHGREYISTSVELGRVLPPSAIRFQAAPAKTGKVSPPVRVDISIPFIFDLLPFRDDIPSIQLALARAAVETNTLMVLPVENFSEELSIFAAHLVPLLPPGSPEKFRSILRHSRMVQIPYGPDAPMTVEQIKRVHPGIIVSLRVPLTPRAEFQMEDLERSGAEVIHFLADSKGREQETSSPRFIKDAIRKVHLHLVKQGRRDGASLIFGGGIALAEHVAKAVICGADAVSIDRPLLIALECRLCGECQKENPCPVGIEKIDPGWGWQRVVNLAAAWHAQILEVLGAMGLRDVRRLRGEAGRAIFLEEVEKETFGQIFGGRKESRPTELQADSEGKETHELAT
ncbi:MAG TPA: glutamate synthase-related protein [Thermodesulfobacteriota bacterium]|nr:glutamate synthase-related protein [Thermodesulfobacteriota bacterium]